MTKYFIVYTIYDAEMGCGCHECAHTPVYDNGGNNYKKFENRKEADNAGFVAMLERKDDRYKVMKISE